MKAIHFENMSEALREIMDNAAIELDKAREAQDEAAEVAKAADEAEDWDALDAAEAEYQRKRYNAADLEKLMDALYDAVNAFEGLEYEGQDVLRNMGLI